MNPDASVDCLGFYCPMPIVMTQEATEKLESGKVLEVLADDQGVKADMKAWCERTGNELLEVDETPERIRLLIRIE